MALFPLIFQFNQVPEQARIQMRKRVSSGLGATAAAKSSSKDSSPPALYRAGVYAGPFFFHTSPNPSPQSTGWFCSLSPNLPPPEDASGNDSPTESLTSSLSSGIVKANDRTKGRQTNNQPGAERTTGQSNHFLVLSLNERRKTKASL